jgi:hypothetical protein
MQVEAQTLILKRKNTIVKKRSIIIEERPRNIVPKLKLSKIQR